MNRLNYLEDLCVFTIAAQWAGKSKAIAMLSEAGKVMSQTHHVALCVAISQLKASVPRGRGYCLAMAQLERMDTYLMRNRIV